MGGPSRDWHVIEVEGRRVRVYDSLADFLLISTALEDESLSDEERWDVLLAMLFPDPQGVCDALGEGVVHFVYECLWEAFGIDIDETHEADGKKLIDWYEDRDYIVVTTRTAYDMGFDDFSRLPYKECCALIGMAPHETPMGQAMYYRTAKRPKETKYNREEVKHFKKAQKFWALGSTKGKATMEAQQTAADSSFAAMAAAAKKEASRNA